jgi:elongation factor Tu
VYPFIVDMTVTLTYPEELDKSHMVMPGDNCELVCELFHPIALDKGMRFTIRTSLNPFITPGEGGLTVGTAIVTQILE